MSLFVILFVFTVYLQPTEGSTFVSQTPETTPTVLKQAEQFSKSLLVCVCVNKSNVALSSLSQWTLLLRGAPTVTSLPTRTLPLSTLITMTTTHPQDKGNIDAHRI